MANLAANTSFELDSNADGLADGWLKFGTPTTSLDAGIKHSGSVSQKLVVPAAASYDVRLAPIFITAGQPYTLSVYAQVTALNSSPAGQAVVKVEWLDNGGALVNYDFTLITTVDTGFVRRSVTSTPGVGAATARIVLAVEGGGTVYWDDVQLEQGSAPTAYTNGPTALPTIINLMANTSFEWDSNADGLADGWSKTGNPVTTLDSGIKNFGAVSQKVIGPAGTHDINFHVSPITVGSAYSLSVYSFVAALGSPPTSQVVIRLDWLDSNNNVVNSDATTITTTDTGFVRRSVTSTPGVGAFAGRVVLAVVQGGTVYWDDIQLEKANAPGPGYFEPDIDWIARAIYTSGDASGPGAVGAISWYIDKLHIRPYEASFAAIAFAAAYRAFGIQKFADAAWNWCTWYRDHMEPDGTMFDYDTNTGGSSPVTGPITKLSTRDSVDSYAGMFLQALRAVWTVAPRSLSSFTAAISGALDAIELYQQSDGLTWALPTFRAKLLMDQVETAGGCAAARILALQAGDTTTAARALGIGSRIAAGIAGLWNPSTTPSPAYDWAVAEDGTHNTTNWATYYPDALENVWTVVFGAADPTRSSALITQFLASQPNWDDQSITGRYDALSAVALQRVGRTTEASAGLDLFAARSQSNSRQFDWNPAHAGWAVTARLNAGDLLSLVPSATPTGTTPPPGITQTVSFWALNQDGTYNCALPDVVSWQLSPVTGSPGAVTLDYPAAGLNFDVLRSSVTADRDLEIAIWVDGQDTTAIHALLNTSDGDDVTESAVWTFSGNFLPVRMEEALVAPRTATNPAFQVASATAGTIMATLMQEAHDRGALTDITFSFNNTADSSGTPWSKALTLSISPGESYDKVLAALVTAQMCEWDVIGRELVMWEWGTRGTDWTLGTNPLVFWAGKSIHDAPRKHTVRDAGTTLLTAGANGIYDEQTDPTALARRGRRIERFNSQGSITDTGSLAAYGAARLPLITTGTMEVGRGLALEPGGPRPLIDYQVGDWVYSDTGLGLERLRIAQLTVSGDKTGIVSVGASLNDLIADATQALSQRIDGIIGGSTIIGTSVTPVIPGNDGIPPAAPQGLAVSSLAQPTGDSVPRAAVFASWAAVTTNADGTAIDDLAGYIVQWRYNTPTLSNNWQQLAQVQATAAQWGDVVAGVAIQVQVAAIDTSGNQSAWSAIQDHVTQTDHTPPPVPSTPVVTEFVGTLTVTWDGLGSAGEAMPADFAGVEIHKSTTSNFTPDPSTFVESMLGPGSRNYPGLPTGITQFFRLISFDKTTPTPNKSAPSAQGSGTPAPLGFDDIPFKDPGNYVEDGSFEVSASRDTHAARSNAAWSFVNGGADHGTWFARGTATTGSGQRELLLSGVMTAVPSQQLAYRFALRGTGVNGDVTARIRWHLSNGSTQDAVTTYTVGQAAGAWTAQEITGITAPALTTGFEIVIALQANCTAGTWDVDRVEVRDVIGTLLVQDAAITNAKIVNMDVGKLTAGTITAVMVMAGMLRTAATGLRYELDANGLRFYDASNNLVIDLNRLNGSASITGDFTTSHGGDRLVATNASGAPEIDFYRAVGGLDKTYVTAIGDVATSSVGLSLHSGPGHTTFTPDRSTRLSLQPVVAELVYGDVGVDTITASARRGGRVFVSQSQSGLSVLDPSTNNQSGGGLLADPTFANLSYQADGVTTSNAVFQNQAASIQTYQSGSRVSYLDLNTNTANALSTTQDLTVNGNSSLTLISGDRMRLQGRWGSFLDDTVSSTEALMIEEHFTSGAPNGFTQPFTYGPTMATICFPIASVDGNLCRWTVVNNTTTGFGVMVDGPDGHWIRAAVFRK